MQPPERERAQRVFAISARQSASAAPTPPLEFESCACQSKSGAARLLRRHEGSLNAAAVAAAPGRRGWLSSGRPVRVRGCWPLAPGVWFARARSLALMRPIVCWPAGRPPARQTRAPFACSSRSRSLSARAASQPVWPPLAAAELNRRAMGGDAPSRVGGTLGPPLARRLHGRRPAEAPAERTGARPAARQPASQPASRDSDTLGKQTRTRTAANKLLACLQQERPTRERQAGREEAAASSEPQGAKQALPATPPKVRSGRAQAGSIVALAQHLITWPEQRALSRLLAAPSTPPASRFCARQDRPVRCAPAPVPVQLEEASF